MREGHVTDVNQMLIVLETLPWSEHTCFCMCLASPHFLKLSSNPSDLAVFYENGGNTSLFYKGTDQILPIPYYDRTTHEQDSPEDYDLENAVQCILDG